uniref:Uncharacterized protein LOC105032508 n=1 Tax=Elaeis guineensis var. tenera TaxID=51953 RepID=A0A6I9Q945_ELAGV|nr:uncharacterized protein LOC105032508 [Elaeis guineensis]
MATSFDRWEKDPFFSAAEEVQEAADRLESIYRQWIQERKQASKLPGRSECASVELHRELHTALGTAKWQLEELERAVRSNDDACLAGEDTRARHSQFLAAIGNRISVMENALKESNIEAGEAALSWVRLDERERDELARFLSCPVLEREESLMIPSVGDLDNRNGMMKMNGEPSVGSSKNSCNSNESYSWETREERVPGPRRAASASADIGAWKILVPSEGEDTSERSSDDRPNAPPPRILTFSVLTGALESTSRMKWYKNGFRKWKARHQHDATDSIPLQNHQEFNGCYERSKSCLSNCEEEKCDKQLDGWVGALQRQLQRSQYQIQYGRPIQIILWAILAVLLIGATGHLSFQWRNACETASSMLLCFKEL